MEKVPTKGTRPTSRSGPTMVINDGSIYVFGGRDGNSFYNDLFEFDLGNRKWTKIEPCSDPNQTPSGRYRHTSAIYKDTIYIFGLLFYLLYF